MFSQDIKLHKWESFYLLYNWCYRIISPYEIFIFYRTCLHLSCKIQDWKKKIQITKNCNWSLLHMLIVNKQLDMLRIVSNEINFHSVCGNILLLYVINIYNPCYIIIVLYFLIFYCVLEYYFARVLLTCRILYIHLLLLTL